MLNFAIVLSSAFAATCAASQVLTDQDDDIITTVFLDELNKFQHAVLKSTGFFVERDDSLRLALIGNPTTGYGWNVNESNANGAFTVTKEYVQDEVPEGFTGVGGMYYFTIEAGSEIGDGSIGLTYSRADDLNATKQFEFPVHIF